MTRTQALRSTSAVLVAVALVAYIALTPRVGAWWPVGVGAVYALYRIRSPK
jgi:hypothetical protein